MITIKYYNNGFEVNGHSNREICGLVTMNTWQCASMINTITKNKFDYYTSSYDNSDIGYSYLIFDNENQQANWMFKELIYHLEAWCKKQYGNEVEFIHINDELLK